MLEPWVAHAPDEPVVEAPLPVPHVATYRDGGAVEVRVTGGAEAVVRQAGSGGAVSVEYGLNAESALAFEVSLEIREVFHAFLLDTLIFRFWDACGARPASSWAGARARPASTWERC